MKTSKLFTIDVELIQELEKTNASKLVNELLLDYFSSSGNLKKEELIKKINFTRGEIEKLTENLKKMEFDLSSIKNEETRILDIFKNIPGEIIEDIKFFKNMNEESLLSRFTNVYKRKYDISWQEILNVFKSLRNEDAEGTN
jgi:hypothetical protein